MQLLEIIQRVVRRLPLTNAVTSVVGTSSQILLQLLEIAQELGEDLMRRHEWSILQTTHSFVAAGLTPDSSTLPTDWDRYKAAASVWRSGSLLTPMSGPASYDVWHKLLVMPGIRFPGFWRIENGALKVIGAPSGETVTHVYITNKWILDANAVTTKAQWAADTDSPLLPDILFRLGLRYMWKQTKGLDYAEDMKDFELELERRIAADRAAAPFSLANFVPTADLDAPYAWPGQVVP